MEESELKSLGEGRFAVVGAMSFATSAALLSASHDLFEDHTEIEVDLSEVAITDTAGLALLLEWITWANHSVREIRFKNIPDRIRQIARTSDVEDLLRLGERWVGFIVPTTAEADKDKENS